MLNVVAVAENRLGSSITVTQDHDDNYLMSTTQSQSLSGLYVKPSVQYRREDGVQTWSATIQESIERYNRAEYDVENPAYGVNFQQKMPRATLNIGYDAVTQSTRVSEFTDAGNFSNATTQQHTQALTADWQYQLSPRQSMLLGGSLQATNYDDNRYADLNNNNLQATWQTLLTEKTSVYAGLLLNTYQTDFSGDLPVAPQSVGGYLLCPPNSGLISSTACSAVQFGDGSNATMASGLQAGLNWILQPQLKIDIGAGFTHVDTEQRLRVPQTSVQFGPPIDQNIIFGGESSTHSQSKLTTLKMDLSYELATTIFGLNLSRKVQPSSAGSLLQTDSVDMMMKHTLSEVDWLALNVLYENLVTLDQQAVNALLVDRSIMQSSINYTYLLSPTWQATASVGYKKQQNRESDVGLAQAMLAAVAINYTPKEWKWK